MAREQVEAMGSPESEELSQRVIRARERGKQEKKERLERALKELDELQKTRRESERSEARVSETDPEARMMKQPDGGFAPSYNVQISTESSHKIVVAVDVTQAGTDYGELVEGINRVELNLGQAPAQAVVDGGYIKNTNIEQMAGRGVELIGPVVESNHEASFQQRGISREFYPDKFTYDSAADSFTCPAGKVLVRKRSQQREGRIEHTYSGTQTDCVSCPYRSKCCPKSSPRSVVRKQDSEIVKTFRAKMQTAEAKAIYKTRAEVAEFPNAWIKDKFGLRRFRTRGRTKTRTEAVWVCLTYNIKQWIRLRWLATAAAAA
jgi:hypothetical protein